MFRGVADSNVRIMPPATYQWVLSTQPTVAVGGEFFAAACMNKAVEVTLHNIVANFASTNMEHIFARLFLVRIYIYQACSLIAGHATNGHVPDLATPAGITDLLYLQSFVVLCAAFDPDAYKGLRSPDELLPIEDDRYQELCLAWKTVESLLVFVKEKFTFSLLPGYESESETDDGAVWPQDFTEAALVS